MKKLLFQKTTIRMTALYLVVLMSVSLFFSLTLFKVLGTEIDRTYIRSLDYPNRFGGYRPSALERAEYVSERLADRQDSKDRLVAQLLFINITVLGVGGVLSYVLARRTLQPIEEAHASLERFTSDAAHELRTPLTTMRTEIEVALMNKTIDAKDARSLLQSNLEEVDRLTHLSERLLLLARLDEADLPKTRIELSSVVRKAIGVAAATADAKGIELVSKLSKEKHTIVMADEASFTELLVILLDNAVKYSPKDSKVTITMSRSGKRAFVKISDQGVGISEEHLPHIFDRFYRIDDSRTSGATHGYGLGLALAQKIAHLHDATLEVTSKQVKGSTFTVSLPLA